MMSTVTVVVFSHNLALGVFIGVLLSSLFFANKIARFMVVKSDQPNHGERLYRVVGQVFFASADEFMAAFDLKEVVDTVCIDLTDAHFWDITSVQALDKIVIKFRREGAKVIVQGMNEATKSVVDQFGVHDKPELLKDLFSH